MQIGVDLAKSVFEVAVSTVPGRVQERRRLSRAALPAFLAARRPAEVLLEACGSAHHWGRELQRLRHTVRLLPAGDVARYRAGNKTDRADAKALLEAARNERISRVPVKSVEQQAVVALHRIRQGYLQTRTDLGLDETDDGIWSIYFGTVPLGKVDERDMIIRD
jgi:transposase